MTAPTAFEDRFAIRELIDQWSDAVNEHDWAALDGCFTEDGVWDVGAPYGFRLEGRQMITESPSSNTSSRRPTLSSSS